MKPLRRLTRLSLKKPSLNRLSRLYVIKPPEELRLYLIRPPKELRLYVIKPPEVLRLYVIKPSEKQ